VPAINLAPASRRLGGVVLIAFLGAALVFFVMRAGHGDPALTALGDQATPEAIAAFHKRWGLDAPLVVQFWRWLSGALTGNFGVSMTVAGGVPIADLIASRLPNTLFIGFYAMAIAVAISLVAGFGMLSLKTWAWWLGLIGAAWSLASSIWGLTQGASWCLALPALILPAIVIIYLLQPRVRQAFGRP